MKTYTHNLYLIEGETGDGGVSSVNLAIRQNEINVARQQENATLFLNQIRIGANGGRMGRTE